MQDSIFIARIFGPVLVTVALGLMVNRKTYQAVMSEYFENAALVYFGGLISLVIGILVMLNHNIWVSQWPVIITVFGWMGFVKGVFLIISPNSMVKLTEAYAKNTTLLVIHSILILALGIFLTAKGYFIV